MKTLPYYLLHLTSIPSTIVEGKFIPLDSNGPQHYVSKEEPHSRVLAKRGHNLLPGY